MLADGASAPSHVVSIVDGSVTRALAVLHFRMYSIGLWEGDSQMYKDSRDILHRTPFLLPPTA